MAARTSYSSPPAPTIISRERWGRLYSNNLVRWLNVIRLLNRAVPIIAIQLSAFRLGDEVILQFTRVLDTYEFGAEPEEEESTGQVDLAYWQKKTRSESLAVINAIRDLTPTDKGEPRITYNKHHIALGTSGYNFCWFNPRKTISHSHMNIKVGTEKRPEIIEKLEEAGIEAENHGSRGSIRLHLSTKDIQEHRSRTMMCGLLRWCLGEKNP